MHVSLKQYDVELKEREAADRAQTLRRISKLTVRERTILEHLVDGETSKEVARQLNISPRTVDAHKARIMNKVGADSLVRLTRMVTLAGI